MKNFFRNSLLIACTMLIAVPGIRAQKKAANAYYSKGKINYKLSKADELMLDSIERQTFEYFRNEIHPTMGIVKDRAAKDAFASIAATGFGLPTYAIAAERNPSA